MYACVCVCVREREREQKEVLKTSNNRETKTGPEFPRPSPVAELSSDQNTFKIIRKNRIRW